MSPAFGTSPLFLGLHWLLLNMYRLVVVDRFSSHRSFWILVPQAGVEPTAPSLEGRFSSTGPSRKPPSSLFCPLLTPFCASRFHIAVSSFR